MRNSSLVERLGVDDNRALSIIPKLWIRRKAGCRGAFQLQRRCTVRCAGATGKENVGISNDKAGEKPARRKTKVS